MCTNLANELGHQQICQESGRPPTMGWTLGPGSAHLAWILSTTSFREGWHDVGDQWRPSGRQNGVLEYQPFIDDDDDDYYY